MFLEVGGGTHSLGGPSISAREGGDMYSPKGISMDCPVGSQPIGGHSGSQHSQGGKYASQPHRGGHQVEFFFHSICKNLLTCVFIIYKILYIDAEAENSAPNVAQKRRREKRVIQEEGYTPTTTYPSEILDIPWETNMQQFTLQRCQHLHAKLKRDLVALTLPTESRQRLEIVTHSLSELIDVY